jgi:hypothetical protein
MSNLLYTSEFPLEEFNSVYRKRYGYTPSRKEYHPIPLRIQLPSSCPDSYTTEYVYVPEHWDSPKRMQFIWYVNQLLQRSRL